MPNMQSLASNLAEAMGEATYSLRTYRMRSALTVLGVIIGVATLIAITSIINGLNSNVIAAVEQVGSSVLLINKVHITRMGHPNAEERAWPDLTVEDGLALDAVPHVDVSGAGQRIFHPMFGFGSYTVRSRFGKAGNTSLDGEFPQTQDIFNINLADGRWFNQTDFDHRLMVGVLGHDTANELFPFGGAVGSEVQIEAQTFIVIGVVTKWKSPFTAGKNPDDNVVWMPLSTFRKLHPEHKDVWLHAKVDSPENLDLAIEGVRGILRSRRGLRADEDDNFSIMTPDVLADIWRQISQGLFVLLFSVASVALLVGGIGVMNIMLMSVTERTHEIGVRKAMGATRFDILRQFTIEAMILTLIGGALGVLIGSSIAVTIRLTIPALPATVTLFWTAVGLTASASIGLFFGIYPAWKAAALDPVNALRYE